MIVGGERNACADCVAVRVERCAFPTSFYSSLAKSASEEMYSLCAAMIWNKFLI